MFCLAPTVRAWHLTVNHRSSATRRFLICHTATINLNDAGARLAIDGTGATTLGSNVVVRGQGTVSYTHLTLPTSDLV